VYFFSTKAFLISAIITIKIIYSGFLVSRTSGVTPIIWISKVSSELWSSIVSYIVSYLSLGLILSIELILILDSGSGSLNIFFIIRY